MEWGTVPDWLSAVGGIGAAFGALWLLKREGDDRRDLQRSEKRRQEQEFREQASQIYVSDMAVEVVPFGAIRESRRHYVEVVNNSRAPITHVLVEFSAGDAMTTVVEVGRILPDRSTRAYVPAHGEPWAELVTGVLVTLRFADAQGVEWTVTPEHRLLLGT